MGQTGRAWRVRSRARRPRNSARTAFPTSQSRMRKAPQVLEQYFEASALLEGEENDNSPGEQQTGSRVQRPPAWRRCRFRTTRPDPSLRLARLKPLDTFAGDLEEPRGAWELEAMNTVSALAKAPPASNSVVRLRELRVGARAGEAGSGRSMITARDSVRGTRTAWRGVGIEAIEASLRPTESRPCKNKNLSKAKTSQPCSTTEAEARAPPVITANCTTHGAS
jgi:hypothetical protein